jgi:hypothetical protein
VQLPLSKADKHLTGLPGRNKLATPIKNAQDSLALARAVE